MGYFNMAIAHADKRDKGMNSTTNEKGTDNKKNNSSEYNHQYYMKNKDKWKGNESVYNRDHYKNNDYDWIHTETYKKGDPDFDRDIDEKDRLGDSDFFGFKDKDGNWTIVEEDMKWKLPKGVELKDELIQELESISNDDTYNDHDEWLSDVELAMNNNNQLNSKVNVDLVARDVINGKFKNADERKKALGDDYEEVQKRVNEILKEEAKHSDYFDDDQNELTHHGILGQKWGIRRFQNRDGSRTAAGKARMRGKSEDSEEYINARYKRDSNGNVVRKTVENMTNEELKSATERYSLEEKYNKQIKDYRESKNSSRKIMSTGGKIVASTLATSGLVLLTNELGDKDKRLRGMDLTKKILLSSGTVAIGVLAAEKGFKTS